MQQRWPERQISRQPLFWIDSTSNEYYFNLTKLEQLPQGLINANKYSALDKLVYNLQFLAGKVKNNKVKNKKW